MTFNNIMIHVFPENFNDMSQASRRYEDFFSAILTISIDFFLHIFVVKKLMTSAYNR